MRTWKLGGLIDSIASVPLKELGRNVQERVNIDLARKFGLYKKVKEAHRNRAFK